MGVVTDVGWDASLAEFDILDAEQAFKVTRTQVDVILPSGTAVLNAAEPQVVELAKTSDGDVIFYGLDGSQPVLQAHRSNGQARRFRARRPHRAGTGTVEKWRPSRWHRSNRRKQSNPEMVMAAVAAARAGHCPGELIGAGLATFESTPKKTLTEPAPTALHRDRHGSHRIRALRGPQSLEPPHCHPVHCFPFKLSAPSARLPGFETRLRARFPPSALPAHWARRLHPLVHVLELAALGLQAQAGCPVTFSCSTPTVDPRRLSNWWWNTARSPWVDWR